jgi:hypothetical protein
VSAANAALTIITGYFPQQERERVRRRFTDAMHDEFHRSGVSPPAWLERL